MLIVFSNGRELRLLPRDLKNKGPRAFVGPPRPPTYRNYGRAIRIDNDVWNELVKRADPNCDNANTVLRRVFGLSPKRPFPHSKPMRSV